MWFVRCEIHRRTIHQFPHHSGHSTTGYDKGRRGALFSEGLLQINGDRLFFCLIIMLHNPLNGNDLNDCLAHTGFSMGPPYSLHINLMLTQNGWPAPIWNTGQNLYRDSCPDFACISIPCVHLALSSINLQNDTQSPQTIPSSIHGSTSPITLHLSSLRDASKLSQLVRQHTWS